MIAAFPTNRQLLRQFGRVLVALSVVSLAPTPAAVNARGQDKADEKGWIALFNGKDLDGWTPKIKGYPAGENFGDTFRVEDGVLKVSHDKYEKFDGKFGHLFYKTPFSHYRWK